MGASLITGAMLVGMNQIAEKFKERAPNTYFGITDFVALPRDRRPTPPPAPAIPPERPQIDIRVPRDPGVPGVPVSIPSVPTDRVAPPPLVPEADPDSAQRGTR